MSVVFVRGHILEISCCDREVSSRDRPPSLATKTYAAANKTYFAATENGMVVIASYFAAPKNYAVPTELCVAASNILSARFRLSLSVVSQGRTTFLIVFHLKSL